MRKSLKGAHGAAFLCILSAGVAVACPAASDLEGAGIRFIGADGADVIHRRLDAERIEIDYAVDNVQLSRSILAHGVYLLWFGDLDGAGVVVPGTGGVYGRGVKLSDLPVPEPGLTWEGSYTFTDSAGTYEESGALSVAAPTTWTLGDCTLDAFPVTMVISASDSVTYTETMMYLPAFGTAVLMGYTDTGGSDTYEYTAVRAEAN